MIRIQHEDFSVEKELQRLQEGRTMVGGVACFVGTVRDYASDASVVAIELEHYPGMTEDELRKIEAAAQARFAVEALSIVHRVGRLGVGEKIVMTAAAARHRAAAFDACRYLIDHLKMHATLWKKEITATGERWVDQCPGCEAAASQWRDPSLVVAHNHPMEGKKSQEKHHNGGECRGGSSWAGLRVGILTLSDSRDRSRDKSGDALEGAVLALGGQIGARLLLPDEQDEIGAVLVQWADLLHLNVILTTGGTGPGPRDVTPEATRAVCHKELPGFAELIRSEGIKQVRTAVFTRGITAWRGESLVINLPGSTRGAVHSLHAVADLVPHALRMVRGGGHDAG